MGVYLIAVGELDARINYESNFASLLIPSLDVISRYEDVWQYWAPHANPVGHWKIDGMSVWDNMPIAEMVGPHGLGIHVGSRFCEIHPTPKWAAIITNPRIQEAVCALCTIIAECLGITRLLYVPDSAYCASRALDFLYQDLPIDAIEDWLSIECGPPAKTIVAIETVITDQEMLKLVPIWDGDPAGKLHDYNGYFISKLA